MLLDQVNECRKLIFGAKDQHMDKLSLKLDIYNEAPKTYLSIVNRL